MIRTFSVVDPNPISIFPAAMQGSVTILNDGAHDLYVTDVNANNVGGSYRVAPNGTLQWNAATALYAFVLAGTSTRAIVNDATIQLANPAVTVDGPVTVGGTVGIGGEVTVNGTITANLGSPVRLVGGGDLLVPGSLRAVASDATLNVPIPLPPSQTTPTALVITVYLITGTALRIGIFNVWSMLFIGAATARLSADNITFVVPTSRQLPENLSLTAIGSAATVEVAISGVQSAPALPSSNPFNPVFGDPIRTVVFAVANATVILPPSFNPYNIAISGVLTDVADAVLEELDLTGNWRAVAAGLQSVLVLAAGINVGGSGAVQRLRFVGGTATPVRLNMFPIR